MISETMSEKELYIRYGRPSSEAMFDYPCNYFRLDGCIGFIPFREENQCAIVFGEPICPEEEIDKLVDAFHAHCQSLKLHVIYVIVSKDFAEKVKNFCSISIQACEELIFDSDFDLAHSSQRLKHRVEKAIKHGLTIHEYIPKDLAIENALKDVSIKWQKAIKGPNIYLGHFDFFEDYEGTRFFYVKDGDQITAFTMLSRVDIYNGWLLKFLMVLPDAVHDTSEFLIMSLLEILKKENCHFLTKGMVPVDYLENMQGVGSFTKKVIQGIYRIIGKVFKFKKRKEYWLRYHPKTEPAFLLFSHPKIGLKEIKAMIKIFKTNV